MRALVITKHGQPEVMQVQERPEPTPGRGEVRVAVRAAGINFADLLAREGIYPDAPKPPSVVGYEFGGDVDAVGEGVEALSPGDRVMGGCRFGGYAERVVVGVGELVPLPEDWTYEEGAAFPVNYATAYAGLVRFGALREGERVLIQAAAGGVGIAATQIASSLGADIFGTASAAKHDAVRGFGVAHPIDYRSQDFAEEVRLITGQKQPLDLVLDGIGGRSFRRGFSLLRPGGRLVCIGASQVLGAERRELGKLARTLVETPRFNALRLMSDSKAVIGVNMLRLWDAKGTFDEFLEPLRKLIDSGAVRPVVAESFPLERGPDAHRYIAERRNVGKVVLTL